MSRREVAERQAPRVEYYVQPTPTPAVMLWSHAQAVARRREMQVAHARWLARQEVVREHDRKVRHFWLGLGGAVGVGLLAVCSVGGWMAYQAVTGAGVWLANHGVAVLVVLGAVVAVGVVGGGHRCVTVVRHWH